MADGPDNPRSLKASEDGGEGQVLSGTYDQATGAKLSPVQYARQEEDRYYGFVADQARNGRSLGYDKSTGRVFEYVEKTASGNSLDDFFGEGDAVAGEGIGSSKNYNTEAALTAQSYFDSWQSAQRDLERDADDAKAAKAAGGAARSYLSTETDKTKEIQRQYKDFEDRASLLYDLMGDEQDFAMAADTQNAKNAAARAEGLLLPGRGLSYSPYVMGGALSQILSPSLSDYVRPDYRLNQAVGLPGAQGFDDPDYGPDGLPMFAYGTGQSGQWAPGYVPTAGLPGQLPKQDYPTWVSSAVDRILFNLRDGNNGNDGRPGDWNDAQFGDWNRLVELAQYPAGVPQSAEIALYDYVQKSQAADDLAYSLGLGTRPSSSATDYTENLTPSEKLAREQFEYTKQQNALKMALGGSSSSGSKISSSSTRSSSSGGGGSTSNYADDLAYLQAKTDATASLAQQEFDLKKQLMLLQFDLDNDPNNPKLLLQQQQLAEEKRQFDATLSRLSKSDQDALQLQRAKIISDYGANPGDAVAREYFLRQGVNPVGNAINIFTGQPTGQQMTLSEVMEANAPIVSGSLQGQMSGAPAPTTPTPEPTTPPPPEPPPPPEEEVPQFAMGTRPANPQLTRDGWTRAPEFISGDPQMMGRPNPEHVKLRVRNGRPEAKVTPLSQVLGGRGNRRMPQFADGTDPWAWQGTDWNQASGGSIESSDFNPDNLAQPQAGAYQPSTAPALNINWTEPYIVQQNSGTPMTASAAAADPYYGTAYQGMSPDQVVTNANSQYYGMTAEDAFIADQRHAEVMNAYGPGTLDALGQVTGKAPMTVVGPTAGMTTGGWLGGEPYNDPAYYSWSGDTGTERPTINVNTQGEAGILTGAQLSNGATQSGNPGAPGYVSSLPPPSAHPTGNLENDNILREATLGPDGKWYPKDQMPLPQGAATGSGTQGPITAPTAQMKDGATWNLLPGDIPNPTGDGYLRYDPTIKDYRPIQPKLTVIESEDQFWNLPPDVQQKILTGQPTGYVLAQQPGSQWRDGLLAGLGQPGSQGGTMRPEAFMALSDEEKMRLIGNPQWQMGSSLPGQQAYVPDTGALAGSWDGLLRLNNPQGAMSAGQTDYGTALLNSNESEYNRLMNPLPINFFGPDSPSVIDEPSSTTTTTGTTGTTGTTDTTGTTGTTGTTDTTGTTGTTGTGTGTGTALDPTLQALAALLGLSYGNQTYQNLPALQYALGNLTGGDYGNISNEPIEVPGLGLSLPGASSMMNYEMLQNLIQNGSFDLLNSLYTAGNVPLSLILKIAQARAPLGNAYDAGMIETV